MDKTLESKVLFCIGDHIDTDIITPGKYLTGYAPQYLGSICLVDAYPDFREKMSEGGVLLAGKNFGCGSSRETAPIALKCSGVQAIMAESFARIFFRNAINIGLPCILYSDVLSFASVGNVLRLNFETGRIQNLSRGSEVLGEAIPIELLQYFEAGGLMEYLRLQLHRA